MRKSLILLTLSLCISFISLLSAQQLPLVYTVENSGTDRPKPPLLTIDQLPTLLSLTDPFLWSGGRGRITNFSDWKYRRAEIASEIQFYEIGEKPDIMSRTLMRQISQAEFITVEFNRVIISKQKK